MDSSTDDTIKYLETLVRKRREEAKRRREEAKEMDEEADELQERVKVLRQVINFPSTFHPRSTITATTTKPASPKLGQARVETQQEPIVTVQARR